MPSAAQVRAAKLKDLAEQMVDDFSITEILEALVRECAYWQRREKSARDRAAMERARRVLLKCAAIASDIEV